MLGWLFVLVCWSDELNFFGLTFVKILIPFFPSRWPVNTSSVNSSISNEALPQTDKI
jgi:hypothetical protein